VRLAEPFALTTDEARRLTDDVLATVAAAPGRYSVHLAGAHDDGALLSLQLVADVFLEAFGNTPDLLRGEYTHLLAAMTHVVVVDRESRTVAGCLVLQEAPAGDLKTVVDLAGEPWSTPPEQSLADMTLEPGDRTAADLLFLAVRTEHRNQGVAVLLLYAGWVVSATRGIEHWTAILDDPLVAGLTELTLGALRPLAGSHPYLGSAASTPVTMRMRPAEDGALLRMMQGVGSALAVRTAFCTRLEESRRTFQAWA
jgi:hypothetical protein